ncbi:large subunit ribosomal protein L23 [Desulfitispora alkaliphila]|uniref:50S ribosomal protein L23 n=1 Tax=Desulfitispora alkaliphila TaxID=622674 RepID=UPI003D19E2D6
MVNPRDIIIKPVVSEKSMYSMEENKYTFIVDKRANKIQIKKAIEEIFNVKVEKVRTSMVKGKVKRMGRYEGKTPERKKAIVTLKQGEQIQVFEGL